MIWSPKLWQERREGIIYPIVDTTITTNQHKGCFCLDLERGCQLYCLPSTSDAKFVAAFLALMAAMTSFEIAFTLDTICPWTYLAKRRLDIALDRFKQSEDGQQTSFVVKYLPYQLYPEQSSEPQDKKKFYKTTPYAGTEDRLKMYSTYMSALGVAVGIDFSFDGWIANTFDAHRLIQYIQEEKGPEPVDCVINSLYRQYFEQEKSPSSDETLTNAAVDAGMLEEEARAFVQDKNEHLVQTKAAMREQTGNGVDSVPIVTIDGKRRDITLVGAKEIEEYEKALHQIVKESK